MNPTWNETLVLKKGKYGADMFVNVILWDSNIAKNTPIGYHAVATNVLLKGMQYNPELQDQAKLDYVASNFNSLLDDKSMALTTCVNLTFSYFEIHKFKIMVKK